MSRRAGRLAVVVLAALGAACAQVQYATGPSFADAPTPDLASDNAVLYVLRETAQPKEYPAYLDIDGEEAIALTERGFTWMYVTPGTHELVYRWPASTSLTKTAMPRVRFSRAFEADVIRICWRYVAPKRQHFGGRT